MTAPADLVSVLRDSQRLGFLGPRPIAEVIEHAQGFVAAIPASATSVVDLGSGGGVPGLVIARDRPELQVTLLDRRTKRTDFLERMVRRLGWHERVTVVAADAARFVAEHPHRFDAAVARGFGPPEVTVRYGAGLVVPGGLVIISEPPAGDRWDPPWLEAHHLVRLPRTPSTRQVVMLRAAPPTSPSSASPAG
jgi:16S rRNA (guanine527-N7)-methyltransferase